MTNPVYIITPAQHAALLEALSNERYVSRYTHIVELIDMLKAMKPSEPVAFMSESGSTILADEADAIGWKKEYYPVPLYKEST